MGSTKPCPERDEACSSIDEEGLTGGYVEIDLQRTTQPDSPDGKIYIGWAVTRIMERFSCPGRVPWPPAVALNLLTKAGLLGEFRGSRFDSRYNKRENRRLKPSDWDDIQFGPEQACLLVAGENVGLHGVLIPAHDFDYWLEEGPAAKLVANLSESTAAPELQATGLAKETARRPRGRPSIAKTCTEIFRQRRGEGIPVPPHKISEAKEIVARWPPGGVPKPKPETVVAHLKGWPD